MIDHDLHNDGRTIEITYITVERDQDHPRRENLWDSQRRCWYTRERVDIATTVHHTLHGTWTERWMYADTRGAFEFGPPRWRWTSLSGGTPPPDSLIAALNEALAHQS